MPSQKKVPLKGIKTLTFYSNQLTASRRVDPIPQLKCIGSACKLYQPEVVQCVNMGDDGLGGVQWRCDTDLPSSLRLGKVGVSCEGWSKSGDTNVLQGSCGLTYNLHKVNKGLEYGEDPSLPPRHDSLFNKAFNTLFYVILFVLLYNILRSLISKFSPRNTPPPLSRFSPFSGGGGGPGGPGGGGGGGGGGPGFNGGGAAPPPPPPYTKNPPSTTDGQNQAQAQAQTGGGGGNWGPGFWTGLAAGGIGTYLANANRRREPYNEMRNRYDPNPNMNRRFDDEDEDLWNRNRGVGPSRGTGNGSSDLGEVRRATGFGGSNTR
ncbi:uncharacterized protein IL334_002130 [Kwoniella shivajii]|uniref:Store-operated calcium entry-associated regulatory factor n=1 Tax=Kwoniella shivajii TaxID=564305 RepID=A0ABZ1CY02_9TREE|nr:hypothetical protein IL334_002130 [Kwoniella shivajii]